MPPAEDRNSFDADNDFCSDCENQQSFSELHSPKQSKFTNLKMFP